MKDVRAFSKRDVFSPLNLSAISSTRFVRETWQLSSGGSLPIKRSAWGGLRQQLLRRWPSWRSLRGPGVLLRGHDAVNKARRSLCERNACELASEARPRPQPYLPPRLFWSCTWARIDPTREPGQSRACGENDEPSTAPFGSPRRRRRKQLV